MSERPVSGPYATDEWSVTLDGRYVVRFCGVNAQELATRQLHELAELLGFNDPSRTNAAAGGGTERVGDAAQTTAARHPLRDLAQAADRARKPRKRA